MAAVTLALPTAAAAEPARSASIWEQDKLTGDWGGARAALQDKGVEIGLTSINETFAILSEG